MIDDPRKPWKAIIAAVLATLTVLGTALADGGIDATEWIGAAIALVATFGATYAVPNPKLPDVPTPPVVPGPHPSSGAGPTA